METIKVFKKKGCSKVELIRNYGCYCLYSVRVSMDRKTISMYDFETFHGAIEMFWYCVSLASNIDKYIS